jgi:hypothetical protein
MLARHYRPEPDSGHGPFWLPFTGHLKDSLWSADLFCCESITLKTHWVLVIADPFTRCIIGFGVLEKKLVDFQMYYISAHIVHSAVRRQLK